MWVEKLRPDFVGMLAAGGEQRGRHGVDLARKDHRVEPARIVRLGIVHHFLGRLELGQAARLVPFPGHGLWRAHAPARRCEGRRRVEAHAALRHGLEPAIERHRDVARHRRAGAHHLGIGEGRRRLASIVAEAKGLQPLHQPRHLLFGYAVILAHAAIAGFGRRVGVDVDQAGQGEHARAVDHLFGRPRGTRAGRRDLGDLAVLQVDIDLAAIDVAPLRAVADDSPGQVPNRLRLRRHSTPLRGMPIA